MQKVVNHTNKAVTFYVQMEGDVSTKIKITSDRYGEILAKILKINKVKYHYHSNVDLIAAALHVRLNLMTDAGGRTNSPQK